MAVYYLRTFSLDFRMVVSFVCWVAVVALVAAFVLALMQKWGLLEWLQVHAPSDFLHELFTCKFCCSFWVAVFISLVIFLVTGILAYLFIPICSTLISCKLW